MSKRNRVTGARRVKVLSYCLVGVFALSGVAAAQASAIEFIWKVKGAKLEEKAEKELVSKAKTTQIFKTKVLGQEGEVQCTGVKTAGAKIIGGTPGTSSETVEYSGCTAPKPSGCKVKGGTVTTKALKDEIVEGVGGSKEKALILFTPKEGETFAEVKEEGGLLCLTVTVKGSVLAEAIPQKEEAKVGVLKFEPAESKKYKNFKKEEKSAGLKVGSEASTTTGEVETSLASEEVFGVF